MVEIKLKIEEKDTKKCENLVAKIIQVGINIEGKNATPNEKEVAKHYENLFNSENKVSFVNKAKENKNEIDELINDIKDKLGI